MAKRRVKAAPSSSEAGGFRYVESSALVAALLKRDAGRDVDEADDILRAIEAGATGYRLKDATAEELVQAIRAAAAGQSVFAPPVASRVIGRMRAPGEEALTTRRIEIFEQVARGHSNREIGAALFISEATVKTHVLHIFGKLAVQDRTEAVTVALYGGILRLDLPERHVAFHF